MTEAEFFDEFQDLLEEAWLYDPPRGVYEE